MFHLREPPEAHRRPRSTSIRHAGVLGVGLSLSPYLFADRKTDSPALYSILPRFVVFTVYFCVLVPVVALWQASSRWVSSGICSRVGILYGFSLAYPALYFSPSFRLVIRLVIVPYCNPESRALADRDWFRLRSHVHTYFLLVVVCVAE